MGESELLSRLFHITSANESRARKGAEEPAHWLTEEAAKDMGHLRVPILGLSSRDEELQHTIEKAVILSDSTVLKPDDFFLRPVMSGKFDDQHLTIEEMEKRMILNEIKKCAGNLSSAAEQLGITRQTLYNKIKKYGI